MTMQVRCVTVISNSMSITSSRCESPCKLLAELCVVRAGELAVRVSAEEAAGRHEGPCTTPAPAEIAHATSRAAVDVVDAQLRRDEGPRRVGEGVAEGERAVVQHVTGVDRPVGGDAEGSRARATRPAGPWSAPSDGGRLPSS